LLNANGIADFIRGDPIRKMKEPVKHSSQNSQEKDMANVSSGGLDGSV
jgi:hypothetical protein